jgi:hypothetical protein
MAGKRAVNTDDWPGRDARLARACAAASAASWARVFWMKDCVKPAIQESASNRVKLSQLSAPKVRDFEDRLRQVGISPAIVRRIRARCRCS